MAAPQLEPESIPLALQLADICARQDLSSDERWSQIASTARNLADLLRKRDGEVDEHSALGQTTLPRTLTALINEALLANTSVSQPSVMSAVFELLRTSANFCMDHDDNRQLLLTANFPHAIVSLLKRYSSLKVELAQRLLISTMELKILKVAAGVVLNMSLYFDPIRDYLNSFDVPEILLCLQTRIYPPNSWSVIDAQQNSDVSEEWEWRMGFSDWTSKALSELLRDNDKPHFVTVASLEPLVSVLKQFTPPWRAPSGPFIGDPVVRHNLIVTDVDCLNEVCSFLESLALDSIEVQDLIAETAAYNPSGDDGPPLLKQLVDFVEFGEYPPLWSEELPSYYEQWQKTFDMCKSAIIKTVVETAGASKSMDTLWDIDRPTGWFVSRMIQWIKNYPHNKTRDDLSICGCLCLGNLARRASRCVVLVQGQVSLVGDLASFLDRQADIKLKHGALGLLKHLSQSTTNQPILGEAGIPEKLVKSEIWLGKTDMAESVQSLAIGTAKHLCTNNVSNAIRLATTRIDDTEIPSTGVDQLLALIKRSDTTAVKSEGTRVLVQVIRSLCSRTQGENAMTEQRRKAIEAVTQPGIATVLTELVQLGRAKPYIILLVEGIVALTLLSLQPSGAKLVAQALLAPLSLLTVSAASRGTSQSSQASPVSPPATCLSILLDIVTLDTLSNEKVPIELRINACSLLGTAGRRGTDDDPDISFLRESSSRVLASLAQGPPLTSDDRLRTAAQKALEAWN